MKPNSSNHDTVQSVQADVMPSMTLMESFDHVLAELDRVEQELNDAPNQPQGFDPDTHRLPMEPLSPTNFPPSSPDPSTGDLPQTPSLMNQLQQRLATLQPEIDRLLLKARTNAEIDRLIKLEYLQRVIQNRLAHLSTMPPSPLGEPLSPEPSSTLENLGNLSMKHLKQLAKERGIKGYSKLTRADLLQKLLA